MNTTKASPSPRGVKCSTPSASSHMDGDRQNNLTNGTASPPHKLNSPSIIAAHEIGSYALIPSMDNTVASGFNSIKLWITWAMHSLPARVESILVRNSGGLNTRSQLLGHSSWYQSPHHVAHHDLPKPSICLPQRRHPLHPASTINGSTSPRVKRSATLQNNCWSLTKSNRGRRCSTVIPDAPPPAPLLADRTFFGNFWSQGKREPKNYN